MKIKARVNLRQKHISCPNATILLTSDTIYLIYSNFCVNEMIIFRAEIRMTRNKRSIVPEVNKVNAILQEIAMLLSQFGQQCTLT